MSFNMETAGIWNPNLTLYAADSLHSLRSNGRAPLRRIFYQDRNEWAWLFCTYGLMTENNLEVIRGGTKWSSSRWWARRRESQHISCGLKIGVVSDFCLVCSQTSTGREHSWTKDLCCQALYRMVSVCTLVRFALWMQVMPFRHLWYISIKRHLVTGHLHVVLTLMSSMSVFLSSPFLPEMKRSQSQTIETWKKLLCHSWT